MKRSEKYRETSSFVYFNANPRNRVTSDCVIRAISAATKIPYRQVVMEMADIQCDTGYDASENRVIDMCLAGKGGRSRDSRATMTTRSIRGSSSAIICPSITGTVRLGMSSVTSAGITLLPSCRRITVTGSTAATRFMTFGTARTDALGTIG